MSHPPYKDINLIRFVQWTGQFADIPAIHSLLGGGLYNTEVTMANILVLVDNSRTSARADVGDWLYRDKHSDLRVATAAEMLGIESGEKDPCAL